MSTLSEFAKKGRKGKKSPLVMMLAGDPCWEVESLVFKEDLRGEVFQGPSGGLLFFFFFPKGYAPFLDVKNNCKGSEYALPLKSKCSTPYLGFNFFLVSNSVILEKHAWVFVR